MGGSESTAQSSSDSDKQLRQIVLELIDTEKEYVKKLGHVKMNYVVKMETLEGLPGGLVGKKNILFSNIEILYEFNKDVFLPKLQKLKQCPMKLGKLFIDYEEQLINYSWYFKNMPAQEKLMKEIGAEYFAPIQKKLSDPFPVTESLLLPFQRMTRYCLFLERMIKSSDPAADGYDELKRALKITNFVLHHGNNMLAVESLNGFSGSLVEQGLIQHQGDLTLIENRFTSSTRRVFLFENIVIVAKKTTTKDGKESFTFKESYRTNELSLRENINGHPTRFELLSKKKHTVLFQADNEEEKLKWTEFIQDLLMEQMKNLKDRQSKNYLRSASLTHYELDTVNTNAS